MRDKYYKGETTNPGEYTLKLCDMIDDGELSSLDVLMMFFRYFSDDEIEDVMRVNDLVNDDDCSSDEELSLDERNND